MTEDKDNTNWKAWYWGIFLFFVAQVVVFLIISNQYDK
jgi:hypothetical protein